MSKVANKTINISPLFRQLGISLPDINITELPCMYPYKDRVEDNWTYYTAAAFKILKQQSTPLEKVALVGIGSGVEGVAALEIFQQEMLCLTVTDTDKEIVNGAVANIKQLIKHADAELISLVGSFSEPLKILPFKQDLVYGNIPNLPSVEGKPLESGADKGTFMPQELYNNYSPPREYVKWALGTQYAYLQSALGSLSERGSILTELGGRCPLSVVRQLFTDCNLKPSEVLVGFKEQTEALTDFEGYHKFEKAYGVEFDFYLLDESKAEMARYGICNPTTAIGGEKLKSMLELFKVNAGQALELFHRGIAVGHTVHIFKGQLL